MSLSRRVQSVIDKCKSQIDEVKQTCDRSLVKPELAGQDRAHCTQRDLASHELQPGAEAAQSLRAGQQAHSHSNMSQRKQSLVEACKEAAGQTKCGDLSFASTGTFGNSRLNVDPNEGSFFGQSPEVHGISQDGICAENTPGSCYDLSFASPSQQKTASPFSAGLRQMSSRSSQRKLAVHPQADFQASTPSSSSSDSPCSGSPAKRLHSCSHATNGCSGQATVSTEASTFGSARSNGDDRAAISAILAATADPGSECSTAAILAATLSTSSAPMSTGARPRHSDQSQVVGSGEFPVHSLGRPDPGPISARGREIDQSHVVSGGQSSTHYLGQPNPCQIRARSRECDPTHVVSSGQSLVQYQRYTDPSPVNHLQQQAQHAKSQHGAEDRSSMKTADGAGFQTLQRQLQSLKQGCLSPGRGRDLGANAVSSCIQSRSRGISAPAAARPQPHGGSAPACTQKQLFAHSVSSRIRELSASFQTQSLPLNHSAGSLRARQASPARVESQAKPVRAHNMPSPVESSLFQASVNCDALEKALQSQRSRREASATRQRPTNPQPVRSSFCSEMRGRAAGTETSVHVGSQGRASSAPLGNAQRRMAQASPTAC